MAVVERAATGLVLVLSVTAIAGCSATPPSNVHCLDAIKNLDSVSNATAAEGVRFQAGIRKLSNSTELVALAKAASAWSNGEHNDSDAYDAISKYTDGTLAADAKNAAESDEVVSTDLSRFADALEQFRLHANNANSVRADEAVLLGDISTATRYTTFATSSFKTKNAVWCG